ncbi:MAG: hypothetical protein A2516_04405 [Alphaproteobacteria bacterium RIFOXYD12_FULL_60_8]|nr:MAG: hypothetical protein A2516_04405 [Alphaproteobacteria bacterium RIFOXYD12_FULL_60_8]
MAIDAMKNIADLAGLKVTFKVANDWKEVQKALREGQADLIPNMGITEERRQFLDFTSPLDISRVYLFVPAAPGPQKTLAAMQGATVGVVETNIAATVLKDRPGYTLVPFRDAPSALKALLAGQIQALAYPEIPLLEIATSMGVQSRIKAAPPPLVTVQRAIAVKKGDTALLHRLEQAVQAYAKAKSAPPLPDPPSGLNDLPIILGAALFLLSLALLWTRRRLFQTEYNTEDQEAVLGLRNRFLILTVIMTGVTTVIGLAILFTLYQAAFTQERARMSETVQAMARMVEASARSEQARGGTSTDDPAKATFALIQDAMSHLNGTGEFTIGRRDGEAIVFLLRQRHWDQYRMETIPWDGHLAEPMRLALFGQTGTVIGLDYRGVEVLAAFTPIALLNWGLVIKIDIDDIRAPYIRAGILSFGLCFFVVVAATILFLRTCQPIILQVLESEEKFRLILDSTDEAIYAQDLEGNCTLCNRAFLDTLGFEKFKDVLGRNIHGLVHHSYADGSPAHAEDCLILSQSLNPSGTQSGETVFWRQDGTSFPAAYHISPVLRGDHLLGSVVGFTDITEKRANEKILIQTQKMDALGKLAGGIAHDFNNMLLPIAALTDMTVKTMAEDDPQRRRLLKVLEATEKAKTLVARILGFGHAEEPQRKRLDLWALLQDTVDLLRSTIPSSVTINLGGFDTAVFVLADGAQLQTVLLNLAKNAADAMEGEVGSLSFALTVEDTPEQEGKKVPGLKPGSYVRITVQDTGSGMDEKTIEHIFDPFFTTKEKGKGTGLGLPMVHQIVIKHGGTIAVTSALGRGTTFDVYLPLLKEGVEESTSAD